MYPNPADNSLSAQFIAYMDSPRFARAMLADGRQGYDCTHISGVTFGKALPSAPWAVVLPPPARLGVACRLVDVCRREMDVVDEAVAHGGGLCSRALHPRQDRLRLDAFDAREASPTLAFGPQAKGFQALAARGPPRIKEARSRLTAGLAADAAVVTAFFLTVDFHGPGRRFTQSWASTMDTGWLIGFHRVPCS